MLRFPLTHTVVLAIAFSLLLPGLSEAKRFKRYPELGEDVSKADQAPRQPNATAQTPAPRPPDGGQAPEATEPSDEGEAPGREEPNLRFGQVEEELQDDEPESEEPAGGLLGTFLHGDDALKAEYIYTGEVFTNMRGGIDTNDATKYMGVLDVVLTADLEKLALFPGGTFFIYAQEMHGRGLTEQYVGDFQFVSNIDSPPRTQISEYWWQRTFLDGDLTLRLGKQDCNAEFAVLEVAGDFVNSSYGFHPTIPMPSYPDPSMAVAALLNLNDWLTFQAGVWDGRPDGRTWGFSGSGKTFSIAELGAAWSMLDGRLPGDAHLGVWYHSDQFVELAGVGGSAPGSARRYRGYRRRFGEVMGAGEFAGSQGVYLGAEQMVWKESWDQDDDQGWAVFAQYAWAPEDRSEANDDIAGGLVCKGLIPRRDDDVTGVGANTVFFSDRLPERRNETSIELFHKVQVSKDVVVQPDLQYIVNPGGIHRDAFVGGIRFELVL